MTSYYNNSNYFYRYNIVTESNLTAVVVPAGSCVSIVAFGIVDVDAVVVAGAAGAAAAVDRAAVGCDSEDCKLTMLGMCLNDDDFFQNIVFRSWTYSV